MSIKHRIAAAITAIAMTAACQPAGTAEWVVETDTYSRGTDTYTVVCVPAADLATPYRERQTWREVRVDQATAYGSDEGDPCPDGPIVGGA